MKKTKNMYYEPTTESRELFLYATNDGDLYRQMVTPLINAMRKKAQKGVYEKEKAINAFFRVATEGSNHYFRDFGYKFNVQARYTVACEMVDYYEEEAFYNL